MILSEFADKGEWNIRRHLESTAYRAESPASLETARVSGSSSATTVATTTTTTTAQPPAKLVRECLNAALDQVKSAVLKQENELVNQPAHILALVDQQMDLFLKCHFQGKAEPEVLFGFSRGYCPSLSDLFSYFFLYFFLYSFFFVLLRPLYFSCLLLFFFLFFLLFLCFLFSLFVSLLSFSFRFAFTLAFSCLPSPFL